MLVIIRSIISSGVLTLPGIAVSGVISLANSPIPINRFKIPVPVHDAEDLSDRREITPAINNLVASVPNDSDFVSLSDDTHLNKTFLRMLIADICGDAVVLTGSKWKLDDLSQ